MMTYNRPLLAVAMASIGLNIYLLVMVASGWMAVMEPREALVKRLEDVINDVPAPYRNAAKDDLLMFHLEYADEMEELSTLRREFIGGLLRTHVDGARALQQAARIRQLTTQIQERLQVIFIDMASRMPPQEKNRFYESSRLLKYALH